MPELSIVTDSLYRRIKSVKYSSTFLLLVTLPMISACDPGPAETIVPIATEEGGVDIRDEFESRAISLEGVTALSYSDAFAQRTGLERKQSESELPSGIQAIELAVERNEAYFTSPYSCVLRVYMDSDLDVEFPDAQGIGDLRLLSEKNFFVRMNGRGASLSAEDNLELEEKRSLFRGKAHIVAKDESDVVQYRESANYIEYYEGILKDLDYAKILINCSQFSQFSASKEQGSIELWLKKADTSGDISLAEAIDPDLFLRIVLPQDFVGSAIGVMQEAHESNISFAR